MVGGGLWALVNIVSKTEVKIIAWGIGLLAGFAVGLFSQGGRGFPFQLIAVGSSLFGIMIGKYIDFVYPLFRTYVIATRSMQDINFFSLDLLFSFIVSLPKIIKIEDIGYILLAVFYAGKKLKKPKEAGSNPAGGSAVPSIPS